MNDPTNCASAQPIKVKRKGPYIVHLSAGGFTVTVFTNAQGIVAQLRSDEQHPNESRLDEMIRSWHKKTA